MHCDGAEGRPARQVETKNKAKRWAVEENMRVRVYRLQTCSELSFNARVGGFHGSLSCFGGQEAFSVYSPSINHAQ